MHFFCQLSPALRNRFTEIWCPANDNPEDMIAIIEHNISPGITLNPQTDGRPFTCALSSFMFDYHLIVWLSVCLFACLFGWLFG